MNGSHVCCLLKGSVCVGFSIGAPLMEERAVRLKIRPEYTTFICSFYLLTTVVAGLAHIPGLPYICTLWQKI